MISFKSQVQLRVRPWGTAVLRQVEWKTPVSSGISGYLSEGQALLGFSALPSPVLNSCSEGGDSAFVVGC